jgi:hypothetical protein
MEPPVVKVFGILHLIFAGLGLLGGAWSLFLVVVGNPFLKLFPQTGPMAKSMEAQLAMQDQVMPATLTAGILSFLIAVPMIIAGIQLLKRRKNGLKWSNRYAFLSLAGKCVSLVLTVVIVVPAMREMMQTTNGGARSPGPPDDLMSIFMTSGAVIGVVVTCIYPLLSLLLLNRPRVKEWTAGLPK